MIQEHTLKEWISETQKKFQDSMPPLDRPYPENFFINGDDELESAIHEINAKIHLTRTDFEINSFAQYFYGSSGDVVLFILDRVPDNKEEFEKIYSFELGVFYASRTAPDQWHEYYGDYDEYFDFDEDDLNDIKNDVPDFMSKYSGYHFWIPFMASTISHKISHCFILPSRDVFENKANVEHELGLYFAWAVHGNNRDKIEPLNENLGKVINRIFKILDVQLEKERYWIIDENTLIDLGDAFFDFDLQLIGYYFKMRMAEIDSLRRKSRKQSEKVHKAKRKAQKQARKKNRR